MKLKWEETCGLHLDMYLLFPCDLLYYFVMSEKYQYVLLQLKVMSKNLDFHLILYEKIKT